VNGVFTGSPAMVTDSVSIQIFGLGTNGDLYNAPWFPVPFPFPFQQTSVKSLGGDGNLLGSPAVFSRGPGNFEVAVVGASGHWQFSGLGPSGWDPLKDLGNGSMVAFHARNTT